MKHAQQSLLAIFAAALLTGCASSHSSSEQALQGAHAAFQQVKEDSDVLRSAPKDLIRAGESLAKAIESPLAMPAILPVSSKSLIPRAGSLP